MPGLLILCSCQVKPSPVQFINASVGLKPEHAGNPPLLEKVNCPPRANVCEVMRVYEDGALYFQDRRNPSAVMWSYLTRVRESGLLSLRDTFDGLCSVDSKPERNANDVGSVTYRWATPRCSREVVVTGVSYGAWAALAQVPNIVNSNLVPRTSVK